MDNTFGKLFGLGIGPGDPELITLKGQRIIRETRHIFVTKPKFKKTAVALDILSSHLSDSHCIHEFEYEMRGEEQDKEELWRKLAASIRNVLKTGSSAIFATLGDPLLYSSFIYLYRELKGGDEKINVEIIPGITSIHSAACEARFPLAFHERKVCIYPASRGLDELGEIIPRFETVVIMKIGKLLPRVLNFLKERDLFRNSVLVHRTGFSDSVIVEDLAEIGNDPGRLGYLSIILVRVK